MHAVLMATVRLKTVNLRSDIIDVEGVSNVLKAKLQFHYLVHKMQLLNL